MNTPILSFDKPCDEAIVEVTRQLEEARLQVVRTFDLQAAQAPFSGQVCGDCSYKDGENCSCQLVVLLVYGDEQEPVSLLARGRQGRTWFDLVDAPWQRTGAHARMRIFQILYA